jgi:glycosyltransferase involved in cell wall biosynthesis
MRIVIDINCILETSGSGNYVRMLVSHLAAIDVENEYVLYLHQWRAPDRAALERVIPKQANFRLVWHRIPSSVSLYAEYKLGIPLTELLLKNGAETVYHGASNALPKLKTIKSVLTTHHYMPVGHPLFPRHLNARTRFYFDAAEAAITAATRVVASSEATRRDIVEKLGVPPKNVFVAHLGGPHPVYRRIDVAVVPSRLAEKLPGRFILFPGPLNERKNLPAFLEAFARVKERLGDRRIAITSSPSTEFSRGIAPLVETLGLGERVAFLGEVSDEEMALLYNRAECLAYPSLFEGFGIPLLEAMACGCPVMASNVTSIPEIAGGAALLFDPADVSAMAAALVRITSDEALRSHLIAKGLVRVKAFSWRRTAEKLLEIYKEAARSAGPP